MALRRASLSDGFRAVHDQADVRTWPVEAEDGRDLGQVRDLLVDEEGAIRYLAVDTPQRDDHVLVPFEHARVEREAHRVRLPGRGPEALEQVPAWSGRVEDIDAGWERRLGRAWEDPTGGTLSDRRPDFYGNKPGGLDTWDENRSGGSRGALDRVERLEDYDVSSDGPDPRGWIVVDRDGERLGRVDHLIGDPESMKIPFLVVDLEDTEGAASQHVLVPASYVELDAVEGRVHIDGIGRRELGEMPRYRGEPLERDHAQRVLEAWRELRGREPSEEARPWPT